MVVQLLYFPGCPNLEEARRELRLALRDVEPKPRLEEVDVTSPDTPEHLRGWGSPTILVDGKDVAGGTPAGSSCRLYPDAGGRNVPPQPRIAAALRNR